MYFYLFVYLSQIVIYFLMALEARRRKSVALGQKSAAFAASGGRWHSLVYGCVTYNLCVCLRIAFFSSALPKLPLPLSCKETFGCI